MFEFNILNVIIFSNTNALRGWKHRFIAFWNCYKKMDNELSHSCGEFLLLD